MHFVCPIDRSSFYQKEAMVKIHFDSESSEEPSFDPSSLKDPIAMETDWSPLMRRSANFTTHKLNEVSPDRLEVRLTIENYCFCAFLMIIGVLVLALAPTQLGAIFCGVLFFGAGAVIMYYESIPLVFDQRERYLWKGRKMPQRHAVEKPTDGKSARIDDVHAIQLLYECVKIQRRYRDMYEMNVVLGDGTRIGVVRHLDQARLMNDAKKLSIFLRKPIWNAISTLGNEMNDFEEVG